MVKEEKHSSVQFHTFQLHFWRKKILHSLFPFLQFIHYQNNNFTLDFLAIDERSLLNSPHSSTPIQIKPDEMQKQKRKTKSFTLYFHFHLTPTNLKLFDIILLFSNSIGPVPLQPEDLRITWLFKGFLPLVLLCLHWSIQVKPAGMQTHGKTADHLQISTQFDIGTALSFMCRDIGFKHFSITDM